MRRRSLNVCAANSRRAVMTCRRTSSVSGPVGRGTRKCRLANSQVVLALLSPYSVRRALDADNSNATDSVCLDEIAYARGARTSLGLPRIIIKEVKPKETMSRPSPARNHFKLGLRHAQGLIDATTWKEFNGIAAAHGVWLYAPAFARPCQSELD